MPSIVTAGASRTDVRFSGKYIDEFALPLVTPLGAEDDGCLAYPLISADPESRSNGTHRSFDTT